MACNRCSGGGPFICQKCARDLVDRVVEDEKRKSGKLGFTPVESGGVSVLEMLIDRAGPAVDFLHALASESSDRTRAWDVRKVADDLFEARKVAQEAIRATKVGG